MSLYFDILLCHLDIRATKFTLILFEIPFFKKKYFALSFEKGKMLRVLGSFLLCLNWVHFEFNKYSLTAFDILSTCWGYSGDQVYVIMDHCPIRETDAI